jgi:hypothetical protein
MSNLKVNSINDASGGSTAVLYGVAAPTNSMGFRNRIINGDMRIAQRTTGAVTANGSGYVFGVDRTAAYNNTASNTFTAQQSSVAPTGFTNSLLATVTSAGTPAAGIEHKLFQYIEGFNVADFGSGTSAAATVTLSFWVRSSVTGTYAIGFFNAAGTRAYSTTYTINVANTFEYKTITIPCDTSGTWDSTNGLGFGINWYLGAGSNFQISTGAWTTKAGAYGSAGSVYGAGNSSGVNWINNAGATFYITGVQLEAGSVASPFERRDYGRELMMCSRYFQAFIASGSINYWGGTGRLRFQLPVQMRAAPTFALTGTGDASGLTTLSGGSFPESFTTAGRYDNTTSALANWQSASAYIPVSAAAEL